MNIGGYLCEPATLKSFLRFGKDGTAEYAAPRKIRCRIQHSVKVIVTAAGEKKTSDSLVFTSEPVGNHDILILNGEEWPVLQSSPVKALNGAISHYEVMV